ncbi:MAG: LysR substrate-binding domain-containing protein [Rhizobiaceae bacterium]
MRKSNVLPPLDYLLAFEAAAKNGSFAAASRHLNISETAISRKVRLLEQHYDIALFVRGHRSITLTSQGKRLLGSVEESMNILRAASQSMFARQQKNAVNLAATNSVSSLWLMPRLRKFNAANRRIKIMLVSSDSDEECLAENMDLTILRGEGDWPGYECRMLFGETVFPVCTREYLDANPKAADISEIHQLDLITVDSSHTEWMTWPEWLGYNGQSVSGLERVTSFNTYPLSIQAAMDGLGIALGWQHLVDPLLETGQLVRPLGDTCVRTQSGYYLMKRTSRKSFPELELVRDWLIGESDTRQRYGARSMNKQAVEVTGRPSH